MATTILDKNRDFAALTRDNSKRAERFFYTSMALAILLTVFIGFSRTYYLRPIFQTQPLMPLLHLHGLIFSSWIALFVTQTTLVARKRTRLHMRLGIAGGVLAAMMVVIGCLTAIVRAKVVNAPPGFPSPLVFLTIPLGDMLVFAILISSAFYFRRRPDIHKRIMLLATIGLLPAAIARFPFDFILHYGPIAFFGLADLFIIPCLIYDFVTRGRPHRATVLAGTLIVISQPLRLLIGNTHAWLVFATWLTQWT
ncbi:MAG TPA: hypothetical protein VFU37_04660 [Pyrinomonadaceae bacterium]|nr:hypothetical protein [Pyrinomonadaceae bacterium]